MEFRSRNGSIDSLRGFSILLVLSGHSLRYIGWWAMGLPTWIIEKLVTASVSYLVGQLKAGVEAVQIFDSWAGILSPSAFRKYVVLPTARIVAALKQRHPGIPCIGFPRLAGMLVGEYAVATKVQAVGLDTSADPSLAAVAVRLLGRAAAPHRHPPRRTRAATSACCPSH